MLDDERETERETEGDLELATGEERVVAGEQVGQKSISLFLVFSNKHHLLTPLVAAALNNSLHWPCAVKNLSSSILIRSHWR